MALSYLDGIPAERLNEFERVKDWSEFLEKKKKQSKNNQDPIVFEKIIFENATNIIGNNSVMIFASCFFLDDVKISGEFQIMLTIKNCFADKKFTLSYIKSTGLFTIDGIGVKEEFRADGITCDSCVWTFLEGQIKVRGGWFQKLIINPFKFKGVEHLKAIRLDLELCKGIIQINNTNEVFNIIYLEIHGVSNETQIILEKLRIAMLNIVELRNNSILKINNLKAYKLENSNESMINISESHLGESEFSDVDFTSYSMVNIVNSYLMDATFFNVSWKNQITSLLAMDKFRMGYSGTSSDRLKESLEAQKYDKAYNNEYFARNREVYRQIKYAYAKQGEIIREKQFHGYEMQCLDYSLPWKGNIATKLILKLSFWFANFGQSFNRPFWTLIITTFILVKLAILLHAFNASKPFLYQYLFFINPLHSSQDIHTTSGLFFDILIRVWNSYMIYNIVRASRRFIK